MVEVQKKKVPELVAARQELRGRRLTTLVKDVLQGAGRARLQLGCSLTNEWVD